MSLFGNQPPSPFQNLTVSPAAAHHIVERDRVNAQMRENHKRLDRGEIDKIIPCPSCGQSYYHPSDCEYEE